jgi:hypothetical protein
MLKGAFADRLVVGTVFLVVLLAATLVSAIPIYANAVAQSSLRERLRDAPPTEANVQATVSIFGGSRDRGLEERVGATARDVFSTTGVSVFSSAESEPFAARGRTVVLAYFDGISDHARLTAGRWPRARAGGVEVVVPEAVARGLRLRPGALIRARSRLEESHGLLIRAVGIYAAKQPSSAYWWGNPLTTAGAYGPLVTTGGSFFALGLQDAELRWRFEPDLDRLTIGEAAGLRRKLASLPKRLNEGQPEGQQFSVETKLPEILSSAAQSLRLARAGVLVPSIQLALLAAYGLVVTAALLIEQRRRTIESLRLRGATTRQIVTMACLEASLIALPAVALAPWLAAGTLHTLNYVGPLADIGLRLEPHVNAAAYALAAGAGAVCVAGLVLPALVARRLSVSHHRRRRPLASFVQRARLDLVLAALAVLGYWQLRRYHGVLVSNRAGLDIDPFLVAAPALLLLAGALLSLRLVPLAAALVERSVPSTQGPVGALGFWQLARRPRAYARSVLLLVLAVAIGIFAATYSRTWHRSQLDQAQYAAGSDLLVEPSNAPGSPRAIELSSTYRALGIEDALPAATYEFDLGRFASESGNLLALDSRRAATVVSVRDDFASRSLPELLGRLDTAGADLASLPLPGRPRRLALAVRLGGSRGGPLGLPTPFGGQRQPSPPSLFLYLRDADGIVYLYRLGDLAHGRAERFEVELARTLAGGRLARPRYPLSLVALELDLEVPYLTPGRLRFGLRSLEVASRTGWRRVPLTPRAWRASAGGFQLPYRLPRVERVSAAGDSVKALFTTGSYLYAGPRQATTELSLRPGRDSLPSAPPVLASESYLAATDASVGETVPLALAAGTQTVRIAGSFRRFPTLDPDTPAVLADLPTYAAVSFGAHGDVVQPSQWWLKTARDAEVAQQVRAPPFRSLDAVSRSERERALLEDPVPLGVIGALALGFVVAAAFAAVGFAASAAAAARSRMLEFAVLRSLGLRTSQLSAWITLESALVVALSLVGGTALGLIVSWLVLPYVALGTSGAPPVPPVRVSVPWELVLWLELALLVALVVISAFQVVRVRGLRLAPVLRSGEGALAP